MHIDTHINTEFGELVGKTVKSVRPLSHDECSDLAWEPTMHEAPFCLIFTDGTAAVVSSDAEGNGPGWLILADVAGNN